MEVESIVKSHQPKHGKFTVVRPGKTVYEFDDSKSACQHLVDMPGYAKLYAPDGRLLMTKGALSAAD